MGYDPYPQVPVTELQLEPGDRLLFYTDGVTAVDYVSKPFNARELLARVNAHLTPDRLNRENQRLLLNILPAPIAEKAGPM
ncbi:MAG: SpoIIE family protein phosphatase [Syntrophobacteraceae bacterium]|jgi:serine phosphatase RsbU (regulator of sigma subunit)